MERELINAFELFKVMFTYDITYIYRGTFNTNITDSILNLTESSINQEDVPNKNKKRAYAIMVEGLQNITRHQEKELTNSERKSVFLIQRIEDNYYITTGNIIENQNIAPLVKQIETINQLSYPELKKYYKDVLNNGLVSEKGGAGLGLIDMAKKSKSNLSYYFKTIDETTSFFYLHTLSPKDEIITEGEYSSCQSLNKIISLHSLLNEENLILSFLTDFNKINQEEVLTLLKQNINETTTGERQLFKIVYQMLQNIIDFGFSLENSEEKTGTGVFFINETEGLYSITTGNYILKKQIPEIEAFFNELKNTEHNSTIDANDSSLIKLKKEMVCKFVYDTLEVNEECAFLSIRAYFNPSSCL